MVETEWRKLIGKRVLVERKFWNDMSERMVNEISPSGIYVKLGNQWVKCDNYNIIEVLY